MSTTLEEQGVLELSCSTNSSQVNIIAIADVHIGHPGAKIEDFIEILKRAKKQNDYVVLLGDIVDNPDEKTGLYDANTTPEQAMMKFIEILAQHKTKILCVVSGNHEYRTKKKSGIDTLNVVCQQYKIPYTAGIAIIRLKLKHTNFDIVVGHGYSAARTLNSKVGTMTELTRVVKNADVYIVGHTHQPSIVPIASFEFNDSVKQRQSLLITAPSWLSYSIYSAQKFMPPSPRGFIKITLTVNGKISASLDLERSVVL
ncbi:MAG: metallophosphoesterase [Fervidobacterium sp.]